MQETLTPSNFVTCSQLEHGYDIATARLDTSHMTEEDIRTLYDKILKKLSPEQKENYTWRCITPGFCEFTLRFHRRERALVFQKLMYLLRILQRINKNVRIDGDSFATLM